MAIIKETCNKQLQMIKMKDIVNSTPLKITKITKQKLYHDLDNLKNHTEIKNSYK